VPEEYLRAALDDNVVWLGWRNDIRDLLAVSSIVVLPSRSGEGLPRSLLEGMAMEKPIVTTDVPGCRQVVDNARNGYLVPPRNSQALADAIRRLASDADLRLAFGQCSRRRVEMEFDQDIINRQILRDLYNVEERQEVPI
jgi:glycosyltransferase involved in cell wall biosynthesis